LLSRDKYLKIAIKRTDRLALYAAYVPESPESKQRPK
jgi:hypothetical protein